MAKSLRVYITPELSEVGTVAELCLRGLRGFQRTSNTIRADRRSIGIRLWTALIPNPSRFLALDNGRLTTVSNRRLRRFAGAGFSE